MGELIEEGLVKAGCTYQHYKGQYYYVIGFALHENTQETLVLYRKMGAKNVFARPVKQFLEVGKKNIPRFRLIEKLNQ